MPCEKVLSPGCVGASPANGNLSRGWDPTDTVSDHSAIQGCPVSGLLECLAIPVPLVAVNATREAGQSPLASHDPHAHPADVDTVSGQELSESSLRATLVIFNPANTYINHHLFILGHTFETRSSGISVRHGT
jgi:hypothetical protein